MLADHDPQVVVVASPNASHAEIARRALDAGAAVVADEPLALTAGRGAGAGRYADGRPLTVFQNRRLDSDFRTIQRLRAEGELGEIRRFESEVREWRSELSRGKWRERSPAPRAAAPCLISVVAWSTNAGPLRAGQSGLRGGARFPRGWRR